MNKPTFSKQDFDADEILSSREPARSCELTPAMVHEIQRFARFESISFHEALKSCLLVGVDYWNYGRVPGERRDIE